MKFIFILIIGLTVNSIIAQTEVDSIEVYLIDAYVKPEPPHKFILSFFTSDISKSKVILDDRYEYVVSENFSERHITDIELTGINFADKIVYFVIITEDKSGNKITSEVFDFDLPYEPEIVGGSGIVQLCMFGAAIFLLPHPTWVIQEGKSFFSLTKEIPILSIRSKSLHYPSDYISLEYSFIFDADEKNILRAGYKHLFDLPPFEFLSPGVSIYTNFFGNTGVGIEATAGLFTIVDTFTFYTRFRYNIKPGDASGNFYELSAGLYSSFFSFCLN